MNKPKEPIKPEEYTNEYLHLEDYIGTKITFGSLYEKALEKGYLGKIEDLEIEYDPSDYNDYDNGYSQESLYINFKVLDSLYNKKLEIYNKNLEKYKSDLEKYNKWLQSEKPKKLEEKKLKKLKEIEEAQKVSDEAYRKLILLKKQLGEIQ